MNTMTTVIMNTMTAIILGLNTFLYIKWMQVYHVNA